MGDEKRQSSYMLLLNSLASDLDFMLNDLCGSDATTSSESLPSRLRGDNFLEPYMQGLGVSSNDYRIGIQTSRFESKSYTSTYEHKDQSTTFTHTKAAGENIIFDQSQKPFHRVNHGSLRSNNYENDFQHRLFESFNKNNTTSKSSTEINFNDIEKLTNQSKEQLDAILQLANKKNELNDVTNRYITNGNNYENDVTIVTNGNEEVNNHFSEFTRIRDSECKKVNYSSDEDIISDGDGRDDVDGPTKDSVITDLSSHVKDGEDAASDDTLSQREDLSSSDGGSSDNSDCDAPCGIGLLERLIRSHPVWFLPGIQRAGAFHLLQGKEEGNFVVRQSSQPDTMAISVRLPSGKGPYIEHYLIQSVDGQLSLESSENRFDSIPSLIVHYSQCCDELPVQLCLPRTIRDAKNRQQLSSLALLGQEFWRYPMANPRPPEGQHSANSSQCNSLSSGNNNKTKKSEIVLDLVPIHQDSQPTSLMSTFKGEGLTETKPARPNTLDLTSTCEPNMEMKSPNPDRTTPSGKTPPPPPPRWTKPSPAGSQGQVSITTTVTFNMNEVQVSCVQLTPKSDQEPSMTSLNISSPSSDQSLSFDHPRMDSISSPISDQTNLKSMNYEKERRLQELISPVSDQTSLVSKNLSGRRRHRKTKESRHYQESDILESPNIYYRSPLGDKQSDYEDIWNSETLSTFKPVKSPDIIKRTPDLLEKLEKITSPQTPNESIVKEVKSPFYAEPADAVKNLIQRRKIRSSFNQSRHSDPTFHNWPVSYLSGGHALERIESQGELGKPSMSVDNLSKPESQLKNVPSALRQSGKLLKAKPVQPPKVGKFGDQSWPVDSSWEFICNEDEEHCREMDSKFPTIEQQMDSVAAGRKVITVHDIIAQRFPHLRLPKHNQKDSNFYLSSNTNTLSRFSAYDNLTAERSRRRDDRLSDTDSVTLRSRSRRICDGDDDDTQTVFSEPWDSSRWENLLWEVGSESTIKVGGDAILNTDEDDTVMETPKKPRPVSRVKSFRERLDPLISPPRLAALRSRDLSGTGSSIRAYALHLASDKSTTFAQNIDNFISCTLESKEINPQVVMRNMRQFMSGMKNYLVKHGEREFEKHVERERIKLKSTEFLNLDAILEGVMHKLVVRPLKEHLYKLFVDEYTKNGAIQLLHDNINYARTKPIQELGIRAKISPPSGPCLETICQLLNKLQEVDSPLEKLELLLSCISTIFNSVKSSHQGKNAVLLGADDFLPLFVWVLVQSGFIAAEIEAEYMWGLLHPSLLSGEGGYYLTTLSSAVHVLKNFKCDDAVSNGLASPDWSCTDSRSVLKIVVPDELHGSILTKTLPVRPNMTTKDVCKIIAHKVRITNPQDYGLFKLVDGEETLLNDTECPQDVKCSLLNTGKHCMLAYKRIDAKIAWPRLADCK